MALLPLSPAWSDTPLLAPQFGRVADALTCVAPLSVEPCSLCRRKRALPVEAAARTTAAPITMTERAEAAAAHRALTSTDGFAVFPFVVLRFVVLRLAVLRFAVLRFAGLRVAGLRIAVLRFAVLRFAVLRFAVLRFAIVRYAVVRFAVVRFAVVRFAVVELSPVQTTGARRTTKPRLGRSPGQQGLAHPGTRGRRQATGRSRRPSSCGCAGGRTTNTKRSEH
jgi:hypothetical protein